jgi:hypothetical protein
MKAQKHLHDDFFHELQRLAQELVPAPKEG